MGERYQKAFTGKPFSFPAALYNDLLDLVKWWKLQSGHAGAGTPAPSSRSQNTIMVRNDSGADADERFSVLGIDDIVFTPTDNERGFQNEPLLSVVTPTVADHLGKFVITQQPLKNGKLCRAVATGLTPVKIDVVDEDDEWADVKDGDATQLQSGASGSARIVYKEPGTGTKWGIVLLGSSPPPVILPVKITGATRDGSNWRWTYTAKIVTEPDTAFGTWAEGDTVTAYNRIEHANDDDDEGVQSGIDLSDTDISGIAPVHVGAIVEARRRRLGNGDVVYYFSHPNQPVIACGEGGE